MKTHSEYPRPIVIPVGSDQLGCSWNSPSVPASSRGARLGLGLLGEHVGDLGRTAPAQHQRGAVEGVVVARAPEDLQDVGPGRSHQVGHVAQVELGDGEHGGGRVRIGALGVEAVELGPFQRRDGELPALRVRPQAADRMRLRRRSASRRVKSPPLSCGSSHAGQGSPVGQSRGPPTELSRTPGVPGREWRRVAVRARDAISGNTAARSTGRGGVVRVMSPEANGCLRQAAHPMAGRSASGPPGRLLRHSSPMTFAGSMPSSMRTLRAVLRPGRPDTDPPGCTVAPVG